jgi:hypothetical protein
MNNPYCFTAVASPTLRPQFLVKQAASGPVEPWVKWLNTTERLCKVPEEELAKHDIAAVNLASTDHLPGSQGINFSACMTKLDEWTQLVRQNTEHWLRGFVRGKEEHNRTRNRFRMASLVTVLQKHLGVRYHLPFNEGEYDARDSRNLFLHGILNGHGGTCVTMPVLYIAIGRRLGYPLYLVETELHYFARWDDPRGERFNIECTCNGFKTYDDNHFRRLIPKKLRKYGVLMENMSRREEYARFLIQRANCLADNLRFKEAEAACYCSRLLAPKYQSILWPVVTILQKAVEEARNNWRGTGPFVIDLKTLRFPNSEPWERKFVPEAKEWLERIFRVRSNNRDVANAASHISAVTHSP